jgi:hypothetical protein
VRRCLCEISVCLCETVSVRDIRMLCEMVLGRISVCLCVRCLCIISICLCEMVTVQDIRMSVGDGYCSGYPYVCV